MERDQIIFLRNFFFCAFIIGVVFTLFYFITTYAFWDTASQWAIDFYKVDEKEFGRIVLTFFTNVRLVLVFLFLVPALAFHWMARKILATGCAHGFAQRRFRAHPKQAIENDDRRSATRMGFRGDRALRSR